MRYKMQLKILKLQVVVYLLLIIKENKCYDEVRNKPHTNIQKIILNQNGYIQFVAYRLDIPQLSQYTFCIWIKSYNLTHIHPIISTTKDDLDSNLFVYISSYGGHLITRILNQDLLKVPLQIRENQWNNICQSWDSKTGWWQVFINGNLLEQGINEMLRNVQIPKSKDLIIGQDVANIDVGLPGGIHGEIFGFNMVLMSSTETPERSYYQIHPSHVQERVIIPAKIDESKMVEYVNDLRAKQQELNKEAEYHLYNSFFDPNAIQDSDKKVATETDFGNDEVDSEDFNYIDDSDYPSDLLTPPEIEDSSITNTNVQYDIRINYPEPAPGIAVYQTPPPLPKYFKENTKASYELKYVKENYKGNPKNEKFALDVLNYLKSDRHRKHLAKKNRKRPNNRRNTPQRKYTKSNSRRYGPFSRGSEISEVFVDPSDDNTEFEIKQAFQHHLQRRDTKQKNVEIINPETLLHRSRHSMKRNINSDENDYDDDYFYEDPLDTAAKSKDDTTEMRDEARHSFYVSSFPKEIRHFEVNDKLDDSNDDSDVNVPFEALYSRLYYTGPTTTKKGIKDFRKKNNINEISKSFSAGTKTSRLFSIPRGFSSSNPDKSNANTININRKPTQQRALLERIKIPGKLDNIYLKPQNSQRISHSVNEPISTEKQASEFDIHLHNPAINVAKRPTKLITISSGRKLIELSSRKCLMEQGSPMAYDQTSLVTWNFTPITLYGGATIQIANPECGNF